MTTPEAAVALVNADQNALVVNPDENEHCRRHRPHSHRSRLGAELIAGEGREKLEERYSINKVVARIEELMGAAFAQEREQMTVGV